MSDQTATPPNDLTVLRAIAEAATPGPWEWEPPQETEWPQGNESLVQSGSEKDVLSGWGFDASGTMASDEDRAHIAAFDPPTVLALLDRVEDRDAQRSSKLHAMGMAAEYKARAEAADAAIARVEALCQDTDGNWLDPEDECNNVGSILQAVRGGGA